SATRWCASSTCRCSGPVACRRWPRAARPGWPNAGQARCWPAWSSASTSPSMHAPSVPRPISNPRWRTGSKEVALTKVLQGEVALVTGASRGIGAAIADELAAQGATVIGTATSDAGAAAIGERLSPLGGHGRKLDVTDVAAVDALVDAIGKEFGAISILVNNAGITRDNLLLRMKDEEWNEILDTNLSSVFRTCKAAMRGM